MWNEQNRTADVHGNGTVNASISILCIRLWSSHETLGHHLLNIFYPYNIWDVQRSKILPNFHVLQPESSLSFIYFFGFSLCLVPKITCKQFRMFRNLIPLKQWNFHQWFHRQYYDSGSLKICKPEIAFVNYIFLKNY
jgi:hypothetical protein